MTKTHSNTKERTFTHLTEIERGQIAAYIDEGLSLREIGRRMERNVSTISRELERGKVQQIDTFRKPYTKYFPDAGARVYEDNRLNCGAHSTVMEAWEFIEFAEKKIKEENWSPDAVVGYAKKNELFKYVPRSEEHTSELQSRFDLVCRLLAWSSFSPYTTLFRSYTKYFPDAGARVYEDNRLNCGAHSTVMEAWEFIEFAEKKIKEENWSPDAVVGYAKKNELFKYVPSTKALYNWIDEGKLKVINLDLPLKLCRSSKKKRNA